MSFLKDKWSKIQNSNVGFFINETFFQHKKIMLACIGGAVVILAGVGGILTISGSMKRKAVLADDLRTGVQYIKTLETMDVSVIEKQIKAIKAAERKASFESGEMDIWSQFNDSLIMGDSRAVGFYYFGFLDVSRVFAEGGATIRDIENYTDQIQNLNPSSVFLCYGLNDISIGYWETAEEYVTEYEEKIQMLQGLLPDAQIYPVLTLPATDPAFDTASIWRNIPDWNAVMEQYFTEKNIKYLDVCDTLAEHTDLYDPDGIHLQKEFYDFWAIDMLTEVMENE